LSLTVCLWIGSGCADPGGGSGARADGETPEVADTLGNDASADTGDAGACSNGERRCSGQSAQQCINGAFQLTAACTSNQVCEAGFCKTGATTSDASEVVTPAPCADRECGPDGLGGQCGTCELPTACNPAGRCVTGCTPQCVGKACGPDLCGGSCGTCDARFEQCVQGQCEPTEVCDCQGASCGFDNCGNSCGTCSGQTTCEAGMCVSTQVGGTCVDLINCIYAPTGCTSLPDDTAFQTCAEGCYGEASPTGADEFDAYLACLNACPQPDDDPLTTADDLAYDRCSYSSCSDEEAACVLETSGTGSCFGIVDCFGTCADGDDACVLACIEAARPVAQAALWGLDNCLSVECPDPNDSVCIDDALLGPCATLLALCQDN